MPTKATLRIQALLDIYSPRVVPRACVLSMMALGLYLLWRGLHTGSALAAVPFLLIVWANSDRFLASLDGLLTRQAWLLVAIPVFAFGARVLLAPPAASDDLLRHIAVAYWPGGYADMYLYTSLPPVSLYPTFDWLVGYLAKSVGLAGAMWVTQACAFIAFVVVFLAAGRRLMRGHPLATALSMLAMVVVFQIMVSRLFLGRPEIFMSIWALSALLVRNRLGTAIWGLTGLALGSGYWLAALYFPAAILLPHSLRGRALVLGGLSFTWLALWWWMTDARMLDAFMWTFAQVASRIPGLEVSENLSIANLLMSPTMLLLCCGSIWAARQPAADNRLLLLAGFFLLSNQARYGGIVAPILALHFLSAFRPQLVNWRSWARPFVLAYAAVSMSIWAAGLPRYADMPKFDLPDGARVLTGFTHATYSALFWNPGKISVSPAFEVGALDPALQMVVRDMNRGRLDCAAISQYAFTHLIENRLTGSAPPCLALLSTQDGWRLWAISP